MIKYYEGTVFNTDAQTLVNTVNCEGFMGAGLALEFKIRYPEMYADYKKRCEKGQYQTGHPRLFRYDTISILNFPTKKHWRRPSKIEWIEEGLQYFADNYSKGGITSIAFPKLGTNNGGLDWQAVKKIMEKYLDNLDIDVIICLDDKREADGVEKLMVDYINQITIDELSNIVGLSEKQSTAIINALPIQRFWPLGKIKGIGKQTYEKIFSYLYKKFQQNKNTDTNNIKIIEQPGFDGWEGQ